MTQYSFKEKLTGVLAIAFATAFAPTLPAAAQSTNPILDTLPRLPDETVECEILIVGGGLAGTATAYESLLAGRTVCLTEITDWVGGQLTSQGTSALDEARRQRQLLFYSQGYKELRDRIERFYDILNPGSCWVSVSCFIPEDANTILSRQLADAARRGKGTLKWFPATVVKELDLSADGRFIDSAIAIQHSPASETVQLNINPLSYVLEDAYSYEDSAVLSKKILQFVPQKSENQGPADWYVVEATETGEVIALADVPWRVGLDPRSYLNPSSPVTSQDPYCTQGFTYTFAMEQTEEPQPQTMPPYYPQYEPYFSYERDRGEDFNYFDFVFTYRRIWSPKPRPEAQIFGVAVPEPDDISMQNWTWGNDYRPGTAEDNLIYTEAQLRELGQLEPGGWLGGLRTETLRRGEENAYSYYYWLVEGTTDSQLGEGVKQPHPNHRFLSGFDMPMGTAHGLSKYPYIREARRIIGRPAYGYEDGFAINEIDFSWADFRAEYYQNLPPDLYQDLWQALAGLEAIAAIEQKLAPEEIERRSRSHIYPDSVGIAQYAIDFHPCMTASPPEAPGNTERAGVRQAHGQAYPAQIPLRSLIPQNIDNLLVAGKSIATSTIAAAAYRVHSFEWSVGAAAGTTIDFVLDEGILPYELVDNLPSEEPQLEQLQRRLNQNGNPTAFPNTSIFNEDWEDWRPW
ncbi:FAD-dependent oxidoreductase [Sphaerothrix gracilis]|uniref:FAD-dependent oxidoreductase n=1 Tax=Sphaerothrix gracilis TaxID=3151835 RepID=UPI0031FCE38F